MKKNHCFLIVILLFIQSISSLKAQTTEGTDFWVTFGKSIEGLNQIQLQIRIVSGNTATSGIIHFTNLGTSVPFSVGAYGIYTYILNETQKQAVYHNTMETSITDYSLRVTSAEPVVVYAFHHSYGSMDATNVLPVTVLDKEYFHISYINNILQNNADAYAVVATQNNTHLYHNGILEATLDAGQVYYKVGKINPGPVEDMIGAHITANRPVAFYSLTQNTQVPYGVPTSCSSSHLMQQLPPINTWGKKFFIPVTLSGFDIVRIVVAKNNTDIIQTGGIIRTGVPGAQTNLTNLQSGQFVELEVSGNGCYIQATNPVGVCSFLNCVNLALQTPAQCWIPAIEQTIDYVLTSPFIPQGFTFLTNHYALVATPTLTKNNTQVSIGGAPPTNLSGGSWIDNALFGMSFYNMPLSNSTAAYAFTNPEGLIILGYGNGVNVSYYYFAFSAMRNLSAAFTANNIPYAEMSDHLFCEHDITFVANIEGINPNQGSLNWYIDDVHQPALTDQLTWSQNFATGSYEIKMTVLFEDESTETYKGTLKVGCEALFYANNVHHASLKDTTFCAKDVYFRAEIENYTEIRWYIDGIEYEPAQDRLEWSKAFETGVYAIEMWVRFANGETATIPGTLKMDVFWVKIRNVRY